MQESNSAHQSRSVHSMSDESDNGTGQLHNEQGSDEEDDSDDEDYFGSSSAAEKVTSAMKAQKTHGWSLKTLQQRCIHVGTVFLVI